jgi:transaldolase
VKILLASASLDDVRWAVEHGLCDGLAPSPGRLMLERPGDPRSLLEELCRATPLPVHASVGSVDPSDIHRDGRELARLGDNVVVQVPLVDDAVVPIRRLAAEGVRVAATLVFGAPQALLAAKAGATAVTIPVDQLEALGHAAMDVMEQVRRLFDMGGVECDVVAAHPRGAAGFTRCGLAGADATLLDLDAVRQLLVHPLTDRGVDAFLRELTVRPRPRIAPV